MLNAIHADLVVIRRDYSQQLACTGLQRRWPAITDAAAPILLERILALPINTPHEDVECAEPRQDGSGRSLMHMVTISNVISSAEFRLRSSLLDSLTRPCGRLLGIVIPQATSEAQLRQASFL